jgi:UDP-galactopyranose mutase
MKSLLVFSHLRWDFVYQRPQHLISRLAAHYQVFFIEEPIFSVGTPRWEISNVSANLRVCRPHTPVAAAGFHDDQLPSMQALMEQLMEEFAVQRPVAWFYTPMALPLLSGLNADIVVYDCMDELSAFKNAPRQLVQREHALLKAAHLVFTGGSSLFLAKRDRHPAVYCFPSSVDRNHFARAVDTAAEWPAQRSISRPRLGFFGVIDERLDLRLIDQLALSHPEWQIIMVGPVAKIDAADLPRRANLRYFGQQPYGALPQFLAGWDVCLLPFAINESTRFISPTKTLEYMAAAKPIVSTPVIDVAERYGEIVRIGAGEGFIVQCERALEESVDERNRRLALMREVLSRTSWDLTAENMHQLIENEACSVPEAERAMPKMMSGALPQPRVVIIGAGPTGLSAAYHLGDESLLLEQHASVGGWCRSIEDQGFTFDYAGHIMFSADPYVHGLYKMLLGDNVHWQDREAWIYSKQVYTRYPFQGALFGLPPDVVAECIMGAIEARVGPLSELGGLAHSPGANGARLSNNTSATECKSEAIIDCCADGLAESTAPLTHLLNKESNAPHNFEEFIFRVWGKGIARHFAVPYNQKLWAVPLSTMETSWLGGRVPIPDLQEMIAGALRPVAKPLGPNARFGYPLRGGFQALMDGFLDQLRGPLKLGAQVTRVIPSRRKVVLQDGSVHAYKQLITTMPLPLFVKAAGEEAPAHVKAAAARLRHVSVRCINLGVDRAGLTDKHWIYYPEPTSVFHRIFVQGNASPYCNAPGGTALTCEITYSHDKPLPCDNELLIERCIEDCIKVGIIATGDSIIARNQVDMPYAYVVYDHGRAEHVESIRKWANAHDIILAGRYSEWEYYNSDHAFIAGRKAAEQAAAALTKLECEVAEATPRISPVIADAQECLRAST